MVGVAREDYHVSFVCGEIDVPFQLFLFSFFPWVVWCMPGACPSHALVCILLGDISQAVIFSALLTSTKFEKL